LAVAYDDTPSEGMCAALDGIEEDAAGSAIDGVVCFASATLLLGNDAAQARRAGSKDSLGGRLLDVLDPRSVVAVPIAACGRVFGRMVLGVEGGRSRYDEADLRTAEELGRLIGLLHAHARLDRDLRRAVRARDQLWTAVARDLREAMLAARR